MLSQLHAALAADPTAVPREVVAAFRAPVHRAPVHRDGRANPVDVPDDHVPVEETVVYPSGHVARVAMPLATEEARLALALALALALSLALALALDLALALALPGEDATPPCARRSAQGREPAGHP